MGHVSKTRGSKLGITCQRPHPWGAIASPKDLDSDFCYSSSTSNTAITGRRQQRRRRRRRRRLLLLLLLLVPVPSPRPTESYALCWVTIVSCSFKPVFSPHGNLRNRSSCGCGYGIVPWYPIETMGGGVDSYFVLSKTEGYNIFYEITGGEALWSQVHRGQLHNFVIDSAILWT